MGIKGKASSLIEEFKAFAFKGNIVDMAIGVIIGGAFGKIVTSFVNDIVMPSVTAIIAMGGGKDAGEGLKALSFTTAEGVTILHRRHRRLPHRGHRGVHRDEEIPRFHAEHAQGRRSSPGSTSGSS